ncbi:MAG TPA: response regulator transcription factor [Solirubrobacteraceae bacterium]|jgi:DNA-binding response OmpR family regulator
MPSPLAERSAYVLVVDDEPTIGEVLCRYLQRAGFEAGCAGDGSQALAMSAQRRPDLVILDIMLPGVDGLEVMRILHGQEGPRPAVILLTAKGEESDRIVGLRRGADDYVVKPFSPAELLARVEAVLRRAGGAGDDGDAMPLRFDALQIDPAGRSVSLDGAEVSLTQREFDLLLFLARHPGRVFSRDQLIDLVWRLPFCNDSSTVTVHVRRLRAKIEPDPSEPRFIQTVWGIGYRFQP